MTQSRIPLNRNRQQRAAAPSPERGGAQIIAVCMVALLMFVGALFLVRWFLVRQNRLREADQKHLEKLTAGAKEWELMPPIASEKLTQAAEFARERGLSDSRPISLRAGLTSLQSIPTGSYVRVKRVTRKGARISLEVQVLSPAGEFIGDLGPADITVGSNSGEVLHYGVKPWRATYQTLNLALLLDCSTSMAGPKLETSKTATRSFLASLPADARCKIFSFATNVLAHSSWTTDKVALSEIFDQFRADGSTSLYLALDAASQEIARRDGKRHLLVCTDGKDTTQTASIDQVIARCRAEKIAIHAVAIEGGDVDLAGLKRLAESTAGSFQVAQGANGLPAAFRSITTGLFEPIYQIVILDPGQGLTGLSIHLGNSSPLTIELPAEASGA